MSSKQQVLKALNRKAGEFISGQAIAEEIGKSRVSVRKAVLSLMEDGFEIDIEQSRGYRLNAGTKHLTREYLSLFLPSDLKLFYYDEIGSTNTEAKNKLLSGEKPPFLIVAKKQVAGRGRMGRSFLSDEGGLYFSLILSNDRYRDASLVTTHAAVSVCKVLEKVSGESLGIKWVNDIYYKGKKLAGILTEGIVDLELGLVSDVIIGVGINYERKVLDESISEIATSLFIQKAAPVSASQVIGLIVDEIQNSFDSSYIEEYRKRCIVLNRPVFVLKNNQTYPAFALDVDDDAHLIVRYEDGRIEALNSGEVSLRF